MIEYIKDESIYDFKNYRPLLNVIIRQKDTKSYEKMLKLCLYNPYNLKLCSRELRDNAEFILKVIENEDLFVQQMLARYFSPRIKKIINDNPIIESIYTIILNDKLESELKSKELPEKIISPKKVKL